MDKKFINLLFPQVNSALEKTIISDFEKDNTNYYVCDLALDANLEDLWLECWYKKIDNKYYLLIGEDKKTVHEWPEFLKSPGRYNKINQFFNTFTSFLCEKQFKLAKEFYRESATHAIESIFMH